MSKTILALFILAITFNLNAQILTVKTDAVKINFLADKQKTKGTISGFQAKINFNVDDLTKSAISGYVDVSTIDTGVKKRDDHLKSDDYFDIAKYPKITFESTEFKKDGNQYIMTGKLIIKGKMHTESITFSFEDNIFKGSMNIQLSNYDVGDFSTAKKNGVAITFEIPVI